MSHSIEILTIFCQFHNNDSILNKVIQSHQCYSDIKSYQYDSNDLNLNNIMSISQ